MNRCLAMLLPAFLTFTANSKTPECEIAAGALIKYERLILNAKNAAEIAPPLACMLRIHQESEGVARVFAASFLHTLMGGGQIDGLTKDARYRKLAAKLEELTLKNSDPVYKSIIAEFSHGDWQFYKLFCEQGDTSFCAEFLPDEKSVKSESPLIAAASLLRLKKAYHALKGKEREQVAMRLKNLYREIPQDAKLQRKFIEQIYKELFGPLPTLGMA